MSQHGWDMYGDDYAKAALPYAALFDAILEMDKTKRQASADTVDVNDEERAARFSSLLAEAVIGKWYSSVPKILEIAGSEYANAVLDDDDRTVLHYALQSKAEDNTGVSQSYRRSLAVGSQSNIADMPTGYIDFLISHGQKDIRTKKDGWSYLHLAAQVGSDSDDMLSLLLDLVPTVDINAVDSQGNNALHYLCDRGKLALARSAVDKGADPQIKNQQGQYPADLLQQTLQTENQNLFARLLEVSKSLYYPGLAEILAKEKPVVSSAALRQAEANDDNNEEEEDEEMVSSEECNDFVETSSSIQQIQEEEQDEEAPAPAEPMPAKRGRGRPKMSDTAAAASSAAATTYSSTKSSAKSRGKRKRAVDEQQDEEEAVYTASDSAAAAAPAASARGRKRRKIEK